METLFLSDMHLSPGRPDSLDAFKTLMRGPARQAAAVYVLGDLCEEFWVGNDDTTPPNQEVINEFLELTRHGTPLYLVRGNRDLLLDGGFSILTGAVLLPDKTVIELDGKRTLIMHGDLLCTGDRAYQVYRYILVSPLSRFIIRHLPRWLRSGVARMLKPLFKQSAMHKPEAIMDVEQATVEQEMRAHDVRELIHGHTHRPDVHRFQIEGRDHRRTVLGDWYRGAKILVCKNGDQELISVFEYLARSAGHA